MDVLFEALVLRFINAHTVESKEEAWLKVNSSESVWYSCFSTFLPYT